MARQFNLNGINGLHLKSPYDYASYDANGLAALVENFDFYPLKKTDLNFFRFINSSNIIAEKDSIFHGKIMGDAFIGSNLYADRTHDFTFSQIEKVSELVKGEIYKSKFNFYFNFDGDVYGYDLGDTGYTINVSLYMVLGTNKRKLKLSNLQVYQYKGASYSGTTSNPVDAGYIDIEDLPSVLETPSGYFPYENYVNINNDNINVSFVPEPRVYDIINNTNNTIFYTYTEADPSSTNYGFSISPSLTALSAIRRTSFSEPTTNATGVSIVGNKLETQDSPFNAMSGGPLFRVTVETDESTQQEFENNICRGNKDIKIIVDYNGKLAKKTVEFILEEIAVSINDNYDVF